MCVYLCGHGSADAHGDQRYWISLELKLQEVVSHPMWVPGTELNSGPLETKKVSCCCSSSVPVNISEWMNKLMSEPMQEKRKTVFKSV